MIAAMDVHLGTPDEVIASLQTDSALARATDLAVQVHSIDPPHPFILRSIELVAEVVAPALGWGRDAARRPASSRDHRAEGTLKMAGTDADVIDALVGITPGSPLDAIRARRPEARTHAQATYRALFAPESPGSFTAQERFAVGAFVAGLHGAAAIADHLAARLAESGASVGADREAVDAAVTEAEAARPLWPLPGGAAEPRGLRRPALSRGQRRSAERSVRASPRPSSTCTCSSSTRATPRRRRCRRCSTPAGPRPTS